MKLSGISGCVMASARHMDREVGNLKRTPPAGIFTTMLSKPASLIALMILPVACTSSATRHTPALSAPTASAQPAPAGKNVFQDVGDATWRVVSAPARILTPPKKTKPAAPPTYDPPAAEIIIPSQADSIPVTQPGEP